MGSLEGKVVIVTGPGRGLGREFALGLAREGAHVVLAGRTLGSSDRPGTLEHVARQIRGEGGEALPVVCDVGYADQVEQMVQRAMGAFGSIDVLVINGAMVYGENFSDSTNEIWEETIRTFLNGSFYLCKAVTPRMKDRGGGSIVCMDSSQGDSDNPRMIAYGASRAGLRRFCLKLANELVQHNIAVNTLAPGLTDTPRVREVFGPDFDYSRTRTAEESVPSVVWLAQQDASSFTGQVLEAAEFGRSWPDAGEQTGS